MDIWALVRARLLGLRLLTLEAHVVVGGRSASRAARPRWDGPPSRVATGPTPGSGRLTHADQLLRQGAERLEQSKAIGALAS